MRKKTPTEIQTDFITLTSHQLRTPLSSIKWLLELFFKNGSRNLTRKQKDILEKISDSTELMIKLVNDLLEVSRLESGTDKMYLQPTDLVEIINSVVREKSTEIRKKRITVTFKVEQEPFPLVNAEPIKIKQAVLNIIQNAITYSRPGAHIDIILSTDGELAQVSFEDTGIGIPQSQHSRVFSKFFRGSNVLEFESTGTGLGMYITKAVIEALGGRIWFKSAEGKGTSFYFSLPIIEG